MGASNDYGNQRTFYKCKEDKTTTSPTFGMLQFYSKKKTEQGWREDQNFSRVEGFIRRIEIKEYEFEGKKKEEIYFMFDDNQPGGPPFVVHLGFESIVAKNILNSLAGIEKYGVVSFTCGKPKEVGNKNWPTLYVNNDSEKTNWAYDKTVIPQITTATDGDKNVIKRGVVANNEFWKKIIVEVLMPRLQQQAPGAIVDTSNKPAGNTNAAAGPNANFQNKIDNGDSGFYNPSPDLVDDLPF